MVVALCALFLSVSTAGGVARSLISGRDIKSRSITGRAVKQNALGGTEIAESRLGVVRRASIADRLGTLRATDVLRSDRILSATQSSVTAGRVLFVDLGTGLLVQTGASSRLRVVNTGPDSIEVRGVGFYLTNIYPVNLTLGPGSTADIVFDATGFTYAQLLATRLEVSCSLRYATSDDQAISCLGVR